MMSTLDRRAFIGRTLLLPGMGSTLAKSVLAESMTSAGQKESAIVLYRVDSARCVDFAAGLQAEGFSVISLGPDIVRQWRALLTTGSINKNTVLLGMGNWDDYFLVKQLAAEQWRKPLQSMQHPLQGQEPTLYSWIIG
jgi:hypothetical protein